ncbi:hypothetical protein [Methylotetracoccus oryzae]|uniref:hypothetical protein n=1 Tax=Methylotetracoccus oryzae TaxID=1919059 RepID=UPI0011199EA7|nr:hypothetical protein [Methylotetracoccus oryzae]
MKDLKPVAGTYVQRVEQALIRDFGARGEGLEQLAQSVATELPDEISALLQQAAAQLNSPLPPDQSLKVEDALTLAFLCGRLLEQLDQFRRTRAEALVHLGTDGRTVTDPEPADLDRLSRFMVLRDRWLRKAADFSLKLLVTAVVILVLGFALGLI